MKTLSFKLMGLPLAKGRPRFSFRNGFARAYTPKRTKDAEKAVFAQIKAIWDKEPSTQAIGCTLTFLFPVGKISKKRKEELESTGYRKLTKPDLDNLAKTILDAMNGLVYRDDAQIFQLSCGKKFTDDEPCTLVTLDFFDLTEMESRYARQLGNKAGKRNRGGKEKD